MDAAVGSLASMDLMPRAGWTQVAAHYGEMEFREAAAHYVFYTHTAETAQCHVAPECCRQLRNIQHLHMDKRRKQLVHRLLQCYTDTVFRLFAIMRYVPFLINAARRMSVSLYILLVSCLFFLFYVTPRL